MKAFCIGVFQCYKLEIQFWIYLYLKRRHYWAFIKDLHSSSWYSCNDKLVLNIEERSLNNTTSYILFYRKVWMFPRIYQKKKFDSFFLFYFFCKGVFSFQTLSLGVTTPHITPVLYRNWVSSLNFQALQPCSPSFQRSIARGLDQAWSCLWGVTASHITPVHPTLNCGKVPQLW